MVLICFILVYIKKELCLVTVCHITVSMNHAMQINTNVHLYIKRETDFIIIILRFIIIA
jgi:hypothetical protein